MRTFIVFISLLIMSQTTALSQVVVGKYHLSATNKDYIVLLDDIQNRCKGNTPDAQMFKWQIYMQVESNDTGIETYINISKWHANKFAKEMSEKYEKAQKESQKKSWFRKKGGNGEMNLFMKQHDNITGNDIFGYESGNDYDIIYEKNEAGQMFLCYNGEPAKSEGDDGLNVSGWRLVISSSEEIQMIDGLIMQAQEMLMSSGSNQ